MKNLTLLLTVLFSISIISCSSKKDNAEEAAMENTESGEASTEMTETPSESEEAVSTENILADADALQKAEDALRNLPEFKGKNLHVFQGYHIFDNGKITITMQNPDKPDNIDEYEYKNGKWLDPKPVQITGGGAMKDNVFPLADAPFTKFSVLTQKWEEEGKKLGDEVLNEADHGWVKLWVPTQKLKWYYSNIETARAKYQMQIDEKGNFQKLEKN